MASVLIVDDHPAVRAGLASLIEPAGGLRLVGAAPDAETAQVLATEHQPDIVLIDYHLPGGNGLSLCLRLDGMRPRPRLILYSAFADELLSVLAAVAGADALVPKSVDPELLLDALGGGGERAPSATPGGLQTVGAALEPEELPILGMLVHRIPPGEIAETLEMSEAWVLARRWAILERLSPRPARRDAGRAYAQEVR